MRNATVALSADQTNIVDGWEACLADRVGTFIDVDYTKRDGSRGSLAGIMLEVMGATADKRVVKVETEKGPRSANLLNIMGVTME